MNTVNPESTTLKDSLSKCSKEIASIKGNTQKVVCSKCDNYIMSFHSECKYCKEPTPLGKLQEEKERLKSELKLLDNTEVTFLTIVLYFLSGISLLCGLVFSIKLLPSDAIIDLVGSKAYISSIASLSAGVIQSAVFAAIGKILVYLNKIVHNTNS